MRRGRREEPPNTDPTSEPPLAPPFWPPVWAPSPGTCASDIGPTYRGWRFAGSPHLAAPAMRPHSAPYEREVSMRTSSVITQLGLASLTLLASACGGEPDGAGTESLQPPGDEVEARAS